MADNIRLDKLISNRTSFSRSDVKNMIRKGLVKVNGTAVKASDTKITEDDIITFGDTEIRWQKHIYIILNKPENVVSSTRDGLSERYWTLFPKTSDIRGFFLPEDWTRIQKVWFFLPMTGNLHTKSCRRKIIFQSSI